jgi:hypothetical protein
VPPWAYVTMGGAVLGDGLLGVCGPTSAVPLGLVFPLVGGAA